MIQHTRMGRAATRILLLAAALLAATSAPAQEPAGRVLATKGTVTANDGDDFERPLSRNDVVYPGETLTTGPNGRIQVRFLDEGLVDLKPDTEFEIERYQAASGDEGGSAVMTLLEGALRTITGAIGQGEEDEYAVDTPVATIGIRGTDYSLEFCDASCAEQNHAAGLYGRIDDGQLLVENGAGSGAFSDGDYFFVAQGNAPARIIAPPSGILVGEEAADTEGESEGGDVPAEGDGTDGSSVPVGPSGDLSGAEPATADVTEGTYEAGENVTTEEYAIDAFATYLLPTALLDEEGERGRLLFPSDYSSDLYEIDAAEAYTDDNGHLVRITEGSRSFAIEDASIVDSGRVTGSRFAVEWGRWSGDYVYDGTRISGDFAYAYTEDLIDPTDVPSGTASFQSAGGPGAFDTDGNLWSADIQMDVDFGTPEVTTFDLALSRSGRELSFVQIEPGTIGDGVFVGSLQETEGGTGSGSYVGGFLGSDASGALLVFQVDTETNAIDGVSVLEEYVPE